MDWTDVLPPDDANTKSSARRDRYRALSCASDDPVITCSAKRGRKKKGEKEGERRRRRRRSVKIKNEELKTDLHCQLKRTKKMRYELCAFNTVFSQNNKHYRFVLKTYSVCKRYISTLCITRISPVKKNKTARNRPHTQSEHQLP